MLSNTPRQKCENSWQSVRPLEYNLRRTYKHLVTGSVITGTRYDTLQVASDKFLSEYSFREFIQISVRYSLLIFTPVPVKPGGL